ncbi:hypothetical protein Dsin_001967 [Dipteronia sinensis]|uniref:Beta-galactosidase n=1 Tax=Dipteronia sinensis TaxID=43782 RepID=A0AAE0B5D4_9ROSI|nr:hypothetical protein Dsin_001967 [Dipteronia sinensis]
MEGGADSIESYVFWNGHELSPGKDGHSEANEEGEAFCLTGRSHHLVTSFGRFFSNIKSIKLPTGGGSTRFEEQLVHLK